MFPLLIQIGGEPVVSQGGRYFPFGFKVGAEQSVVVPEPDLYADGGSADERVGELIKEAFARFNEELEAQESDIPSELSESDVPKADTPKAVKEIQVALSKALPESIVPIEALQSPEDVRLFVRELVTRKVDTRLIKLLLLMMYE